MNSCDVKYFLSCHSGSLSSLQAMRQTLACNDPIRNRLNYNLKIVITVFVNKMPVRWKRKLFITTYCGYNWEV